MTDKGGNEGVVGIALFLGGRTRLNHAIVQVAEGAFRLGRPPCSPRSGAGSLHQALLRSTQALLTQASQTAVCHQLHSIPQRLCRWLLLTCDRVPTDSVLMTHEFLAQMLGVRRASGTEVTQNLQRVGAIRYQRGRLTLLDRPSLEAMVCEGYAGVQTEFRRLLDSML